MTGITGFCPRCLGPVEIAGPLEPLYTLDAAALWVPCTRSGLRQLMSVHKSKLQAPIYRRDVNDPRLRRRFLYASDLVALRGVLFSGERYVSKRKKAQP